MAIHLHKGWNVTPGSGEFTVAYFSREELKAKLHTDGDGLKSAPLPPDIGGSLNDGA
jgi:hypothetical protein